MLNYQRVNTLTWNRMKCEEIPGSSKKQPSHEVPHHRSHAPPVPQFNVVFWILCLAAFKKNSHFCWWCSALPITTLKLGVAGVSRVSLWFPVDGCFFWRTRWVFFWGFRVHFNCCWYACGCRSAHIHTSMRQHQLLKFTHCQSMRFCNLWQPNKGGC